MNKSNGRKGSFRLIVPDESIMVCRPGSRWTAAGGRLVTSLTTDTNQRQQEKRDKAIDPQSPPL